MLHIIFIFQISLFETSVQKVAHQSDETNYRRSMLLSQNYPISPIPTGPVLPGVSYFNKIYNMLDGTDLLEKPGRDIYTFRYSNMVQTWTSQYTYLVPVEFTGIPNIYPQCTKDITLSTMKEIWSKSLITEESSEKSSTLAFSLSAVATILSPVLNVVLPGVGTAISTMIMSQAFKDTSMSMQKGNSRNTKTARTKRGEGYQKTYSLNAEVSLYEGRIAWDQLNDFSLKSEFQFAINILELSATNSEILQFIELWGTHVIKSARMGAMCEESVYVKSSVAGYDYTEFYEHTKNRKRGILFWSSSSSTTTTMTQSGTFNNELHYEFTDVRCEGECGTSQPCGGMTGTGFWVKPVEYELIPIWSIHDLMSIGLSGKFQLFVANIMKASLECRINHCNNNGICTLRDDVFTSQFVFIWNGITFNDMIDYNRACYCDDGYVGHLCAPTPSPTTPHLTPHPTPRFTRPCDPNCRVYIYTGK
eukprot:519397_1